MIYAENLKGFLELFKVGTLKMIPNPFSVIFGSYDSESLSSP